MEVAYSKEAKEDLQFWLKSGNKTVQKKITALIESISETPFEGIGKPEPLKHDLSGAWSRRINEEHRLIYKLEEGRVFILALRGHY